MTSESEIMLLVNSQESSINEETGEETKLEPPVVRWKKLLGDKNPEEAKINEPETLRALFGTDLIRNAFHGSDDERLANKERDIFLFPIPERPPEFEYIRTKLNMEMILKFLFPPNLEHANSTGRLDLLALYGPVVNHHSVDYCFDTKSVSVAKEQLQQAIAERQAAADKKKMGSTLTSGVGQSASIRGKVKSGGVGGGSMATATTKKIKDPPIRLLKEVDVQTIYTSLSKESRAHVEGFVHLPCGRGGQHLMNDIEIDELITQINTNDLLDLLTVEKGSIAKIMIESMNMNAPEEIMYTEEHVRELLKDLETDYYERYEFDDLQKMILEDRRLRMNYWISMITKKPIEKFKNPNLLNMNEKVDRKDIKNPYFSLTRILPISLHMQKSNSLIKPDGFDKIHFDYRSKLH